MLRQKKVPPGAKDSAYLMGSAKMLKENNMKAIGQQSEFTIPLRAPVSMRTLMARALEQERSELWEEWTDDGSLSDRLDRLTAMAATLADRPSVNPSPEETLVRQSGPVLLNAWASIVAANSATAQDQEAARQAQAALFEP